MEPRNNNKQGKKKTTKRNKQYSSEKKGTQRNFFGHDKAIYFSIEPLIFKSLDEKFRNDSKAIAIEHNLMAQYYSEWINIFLN
jgi:hypothetical protein